MPRLLESGLLGLRWSMAYYLFIRTRDPPSGWELLEAVKSEGVAIQALKDYKRMLGGQKVTEIVMVEASSVGDARGKLEYQDD
jgi:hypothetical protein